MSHMHLFFMMLPPSTLLIKVQMAVTLYFLQQSGITLWNQQLVVLEAFHAARTSPLSAYQLLGNCQTRMFPLVLHISLPVHVSQPTIGYATHLATQAYAQLHYLANAHNGGLGLWQCHPKSGHTAPLPCITHM